MLSWTVGAVKITRVVELEMPVAYSAEQPFLAEATPEALRRMPWLYPDFVDEEDRMRLSIHALLVEAPGLRLVVDTCVGNDKIRPGLIGKKPLSTNFLGYMTEVGWSRETLACGPVAQTTRHGAARPHGDPGAVPSASASVVRRHIAGRRSSSAHAGARLVVHQSPPAAARRRGVGWVVHQRTLRG